jgi:hypothetical protein
MQVQMQAFTKRSHSLRSAIVRDLRKHEDSALIVLEAQNPKRKPGWAKVRASGQKGAINIEWDADQRMLVARVIAEKGNSPLPLLGEFIHYLLEVHGKRITALNVQLRH